MTASASAQPTPLLPPRSRVPFTSEKGELDSASFSMLQQWFKSINGLSPTISCNATNVTNVYTLTPFNISPFLPQYLDYWGFAFVSPFTSTGTVTATVVPATGTLATLPVYKANGATAAAAGDLVINSFYILYYVDSLNSGNGGFVIK